MKKPVINARELNGWKHLGNVLIHHEDETMKKKEMIEYGVGRFYE